jgi:hypothetical protein|tara:strand:+ start:287 stop:556 length:270 start_codon:yes stop_codon:yes gene_type:complete
MPIKNKPRNDLSFHKTIDSIFKETFSPESVLRREIKEAKDKEMDRIRWERKWSIDYEKELERNDLTEKQRQTYRKYQLMKEKDEFPDLD